MIRNNILTAVAYAPTLFFVPRELAIMNIAVNMILMLMAIVLELAPPLVFMATIVTGHAVFAMLSFREPHIVNLARAVGKARNSTSNLVRSRHTKFVP